MDITVSKLNAILPLAGVALGWGLKALSDYLSSKVSEYQNFRKAAFYLLKIYKALLDYDRATTYFRKDNPTVDQFEPRRLFLEQILLNELKMSRETTSAATELIATVDPPLAIHLHNILKGIKYVLLSDRLDKAAEEDHDVYAGLLITQDKVIATALIQLRDTILKIAERSGFGQKRKIRSWIDERIRGEEDFVRGMRDQADIRNRAFALKPQADQ